MHTDVSPAVFQPHAPDWYLGPNQNHGTPSIRGCINYLAVFDSTNIIQGLESVETYPDIINLGFTFEDKTRPMGACLPSDPDTPLYEQNDWVQDPYSTCPHPILAHAHRRRIPTCKCVVNCPKREGSAPRFAFLPRPPPPPPIEDVEDVPVVAPDHTRHKTWAEDVKHWVAARNRPWIAEGEWCPAKRRRYLLEEVFPISTRVGFVRAAENRAPYPQGPLPLGSGSWRNRFEVGRSTAPGYSLAFEFFMLEDCPVSSERCALVHRVSSNFLHTPEVFIQSPRQLKIQLTFAEGLGTILSVHDDVPVRTCTKPSSPDGSYILNPYHISVYMR